MSKHTSIQKLIILILLLLSFSQAEQICNQFTSAQLVYNSQKLGQEYPKLQNCGQYDCSDYIWVDRRTKFYQAQYSCFGLFGPISSVSKLGALGELDPDMFTNKYIQECQQFENKFNLNDISSKGSLGDYYFYNKMINNENDIHKHMQGLGLFSVFGPLGPLGDLGLLGPRGPTGPHIYMINREGQYVDNEQNIHTHAEFKWDGEQGETKIWPLFENYTQQKAIEMSKQGLLDTSFMIYMGSDMESIIVNSEGNEFVTIVVVPIISSDRGIPLYIHDINEDYQQAHIKSTSEQFINWVQLDIKEKTSFKITVGQNSRFNLHVIGSSSNMKRKEHIQYEGNWISQCRESVCDQ